MRRFFTLLFALPLLVPLLARAGVTVSITDGNQYNITELTFTVSNDADCQSINWTTTDNGAQVNVEEKFTYGYTGVIKFTGDQVSGAGLDAVLSKFHQDTKATVNLTGIALGTLTSVNAKIQKLTLPAGTAMPSTAVLATGTNLQYVYSPAASGDDASVSLWFAASLQDWQINQYFPEATTPWLAADSTTPVYVYGPGADTALSAFGSSHTNISKPWAFSGTLDVTAGSVSGALAAFNTAGNHSVQASEVVTLAVAGTLTEEDIAYINQTLTAVTTIIVKSGTAPAASDFTHSPMTIVSSLLTHDNGTGGGLAAWLAALSDEQKQYATRLDLTGTLTKADMQAFTALPSTVTLLNLYGATYAEGVSIFDFSSSRNQHDLDIIVPGNLSPAQLYSLYNDEDSQSRTIRAKLYDNLQAIGNIYAYNYPVDGQPTMLSALFRDKSHVTDARPLIEGTPIHTLSAMVQNDDQQTAALEPDDIKKFNDYSDLWNLLLDRMHISTTTAWQGDGTQSLLTGTIRRVLCPDGFDPKGFNYTTSTVQIVQSYCEMQYADGSGVSHTHHLERMFIRQAGSTKGLTHYQQDDRVARADWMEIEGNINDDDIAFLSGIQNKGLSLNTATWSGTDNGLRSLSNPYIEYLTLPRNHNVIDATTKDACAFTTACTKLVGVAVKEDGNTVRLAPDGGGDAPQTVAQEPADFTLTTYTRYAQDVTPGAAWTETTPASEEFVTAHPFAKKGHMAHLFHMLDMHSNGEPHLVGVRASGYLDASDISVDAASGGYINAEGHLCYGPDTEAHFAGDAGYDATDVETAAQALTGCREAKYWDLSKALFPVNRDMNFSLLSVGEATTDKSLKALWLPTDTEQKLLPYKSLAQKVQNLDDGILTIPYNYEVIDSYALYNNTALVHYNTTDAQGNVVDAGADANPNHTTPAGRFTMTLSANLKRIGTSAFWGAKRLTDVYVLAETAPVCEVNAFDGVAYFGNNGFSPSYINGVTRDTYHNGDDWQEQLSHGVFAVLHWPNTCDATNVKRYTDVTRRYSCPDEMGNTDGDGKIIRWPNQVEYGKAFSQATNGFLWNAWEQNTTNDQGTTEQASYEAFASQETANGYYTACTNEGKASAIFYATTGEGKFDEQTSAEMSATAVNGGAYDKTIYDHDYRGWHQFVLTNNVDYTEERPMWNFDAYKENDWYTLCVPFDMTLTDVVRTFGVDNTQGTEAVKVKLHDGTVEQVSAGAWKAPTICTLINVKRNVETKYVTLVFSTNLCDRAASNETTNGDYTITSGKATATAFETSQKDAGGITNGNRIVVKAGYPYHIKPYLPAELDASGNAVKTGLAKRFERPEPSESDRDYDATRKTKTPYTGWMVKSVDKDGNDWVSDSDPNNFEYTFLGTYEEMPIKKYTFFLAPGTGGNKWFHDTWDDYEGTSGANTAFIIAEHATVHEDPEFITGDAPQYSGTSADPYGQPQGQETFAAPTKPVTKPTEPSGGWRSENTFKPWWMWYNPWSDYLWFTNVGYQKSKLATAFTDLYDDDDELPGTTSIADTQNREPDANAAVYDLSGRLVRPAGSRKALEPGLYISNGRRYINR